MAAANTDLFIKVASNTGWQLDASGISDASVTSFGLVSATSLPTDTAVILTIDRVDSSGTATPSKMERIIGVVSGTTVTSCVRGLEGTAQAHSAGAVVEIVISKSNINKLMEGILAEHNQDGSHHIDALDTIRYSADAGGDDTYAVTLTPTPTSYYAGMEVNFKPTTANTGACTLDVNGLGAKTIKKNVSSDLETGDILSGQMVKVIYDGTNFQLVNDIPIGTSGWNAYSTVVPTRASADDPTYVLTFAGVDLTSMLSVGMRIKWTQNSTVRYAIITAISFSTNTTLTVYGGTDYDVDDTATFAISAFYFSMMKSPVGFPLDPLKWSVETSSTADDSQASPSDATVYNLGSRSLVVPIGSWRLETQGTYRIDGSATNKQGIIGISTSSNSFSEAKLKHHLLASYSAGYLAVPFHRAIDVLLAAKTTYYLVAQTTNSPSAMTCSGSQATTIIRAVSRYL